MNALIAASLDSSQTTWMLDAVYGTICYSNLTCACGGIFVGLSGPAIIERVRNCIERMAAVYMDISMHLSPVYPQHFCCHSG